MRRVRLVSQMIRSIRFVLLFPIRRWWRWRHRLTQLIAPFITLALVLIVWQSVAEARLYPPFIIPFPRDVWAAFLKVSADGRLLTHVLATMQAVLLGLVLGVSVAIVLGYAIAKNQLLGSLLSPLIVALQATPVVAYAPLLLIWFGSGIESKVITCALIVFFPMLMNTIVGIQNVPQNLRDLMRSLKAKPWQMLIHLDLPAAMPVMLTGLKLSATLAVIGATVGEFIGARVGLGFLINLARSNYDTPLVIVAVLTLTALALTMFGVVSLIERRVLFWQARMRRNAF
jgi:NitT/TauT family transport system permease protein